MAKDSNILVEVLESMFCVIRIHCYRSGYQRALIFNTFEGSECHIKPDFDEGRRYGIGTRWQERAEVA